MSLNAVTSKGIFHGLPTFPEHDDKGYTAIVAGASGISGAYLIRSLSETPSRWTKIYALSRRAPAGKLPENVEHIPIDLLDEPDRVAEKLRAKAVKADYAFFVAYIQPPPKLNEGLWSDTEETERVNVRLLDTFLKALKLTDSVPKRILLQTGAKHYGVHLGPTLTPMEESDPRFLKEPNFYFAQEDLLWKWSKENNVGWTITRPGYILGAVPDAAMNLTYGLALFASVQKELGRKLTFPSDARAWETLKDLSTAGLIGYHAEWAVLTAGAENQILNIADDSPFTYGKFWPVLANWYDVDYDVPEADRSQYRMLKMPTEPPPSGFGEAGTIKSTWSLEEWASQPEVRKAWQTLQKRYGLIAPRDPFENPKDYFGLVDTDVLGPWGRSLSMGKSRKLGWHGYVDSHDAIFDTIRQLSEMEMVPPLDSPGNDMIHYHGYRSKAL